MWIPIALLFTILLVLPAALLGSLWRGRGVSRAEWLVKVLYTGAFVCYVLLAGRWDWLSYHLRYGLAAAFAAALLVSARRITRHPRLARRTTPGWVRLALAFVTLIVFSAALAAAVLGRAHPDPVPLRFPLDHGWFYVGQGGSTTMINAHHSFRAQQYALDIVALDRFGRRARGLYPDVLDRYVIFGATVSSPCRGRVTSAVDGLPDHVPPATDRQHPAGNHVVIRCDGVLVLLAHLQAGSLVVRQAMTVAAGDAIGRVGNSGNTSEPHLHIHAVREGSGTELTGVGVPMLFDGRLGVRNTTFRR